MFEIIEWSFDLAVTEKMAGRPGLRVGHNKIISRVMNCLFQIIIGLKHGFLVIFL